MSSYYGRELLRNTFSTWKTYYSQRKLNWRLIIKADVHYSFHLRLKCLKIWQLRALKKRSDKIKSEIAKIFYEKRLKQVYFLWLKYNTKHRFYRKKMRQILIEQLVICYSHLEVLVYSYTFVCLKLNILADNYNIWKWKTIYLKRYLCKLLNYSNYSAFKRNRNETVKMFLKNKYDAETLRPYFQNWIVWTNRAIKINNKFATAEKYYKQKLLWKSFNQLFLYANYAQEKRNNKELALEHYKIKAQNHFLSRWICYTNKRLLKNNRITEVELYYIRKLKYNFFFMLLKYGKFKKRNKQLHLFVKERCEAKIRNKYFGKLKKYWSYRKMKLHKFNVAVKHYDNYLLKYSFSRLKLYYNSQRRKKQYHKLAINTLEQKRNFGRLNFCFQQWKHLKIVSQQEKLLMSKSEVFYNTILLRKVFVNWITYTGHKIYFTGRNKNIIKRVMLMRWRNFTWREREFKKKLNIAKNMYENELFLKGLTFFLKAGNEKQCLKKQRALSMFERDFQLQFKYYYIWKRKTLTNVKQVGNFIRGQSNLGGINEVFKWNSLCFQKPKIPDNFCLL